MHGEFKAGLWIQFSLMFLFAAMMALAPLLEARAATRPMAGTLANEPLWPAYRDRFIKGSGRVVDNANKNISHSEGQGFALLMAVAAEDRETFARIWAFTKKELMVRDDNLVAWRWAPGFGRNVTDKNNATDGDLLISWALLEAANAGFSNVYRTEAKRILSDLRRLVHKDAKTGLWMRPGIWGFTAAEHSGRDIINMSYWVFPALERISDLTGDPMWRKLGADGEKLLAKSMDNRGGLPPDWNAYSSRSGSVGFAPKFSTRFSYNAIRVPLYLAWSDADRSSWLARFQKNWVGRKGQLAQVDVRLGRSRGKFADLGYQAVAHLVTCSQTNARFPGAMRTKLDKLYYPASLHLLTIIAAKQRYPQCW